MSERKERVELLINYLYALISVGKNSSVKVFSEIQRTIGKIENELNEGTNENDGNNDEIGNETL